MISEVPEIRMLTKIRDRDFDVKPGLIQKLLADGNRVRVSIILRGREITQP